MFSRSDGMHGFTTKRDKSDYPKLTPEARLLAWYKKIFRTTFLNNNLPKPLKLQLPKRIKRNKNFDDPWVELQVDGSVTHISTGELVCSYDLLKAA